MLGALIATAFGQGPQLFVEQPTVFLSVIISLYIGNVVLPILNLPFISYIARLRAIKKELLIPMILAHRKKRSTRLSGEGG